MSPRPDADAPVRARSPSAGGLKQLLGSLLFNVVMWASVLIYAPLSLLTFPFPFAWRFRFISQWARFQIWLVDALCGLKYQVHGRDRLPPGPAIVMAKHQSTWETFALALIFPPQTWVLKRDVLWVPLFGWALALLRPIAIDRKSKSRAIQQVIAKGRERLRAGIWITVFPEGTRVAPGERRRWGYGGALLAAATGYPVVPVAHNAGHYWRRRGFLKRAGTIQVVIGPAIDPHGLDAKEILERAEDWVAQTMQQLENNEKLKAKN